MKKTIIHYPKKQSERRRDQLRKRSRYALFLFVLCFANIAIAQQHKKTNAADSSKMQYKNVKISYRPLNEDKPYCLSVTAGTTGAGVEVKKLLDHNLALKAGFSFLPQLSITRSATADFNNNSKYSGDFSKAQLLLEYSPFQSQGIRLVGGGAYVFALKTTIDRVPTGNYTYGDIVYTPSQIGTVHTVADWKGPAAYLGLGFFRIVPERRFNVTLDLGTYYLSSPQTSITGTNLLAVNASANNEIHWNENVSQYRWLPVLQLNFNFRLDRTITTKTNTKK